MTALAMTMMEKAREVLDHHHGSIEWEDLAIAYAALAQAEQLKRIADSLERMAHPDRVFAPDPLDYYDETAYKRDLEEYQYHKNAKPGESMDEYQERIAGTVVGGKTIAEWQARVYHVGFPEEPA